MIFGVIVKLLLLGYGEVCDLILHDRKKVHRFREGGDGTGIANINKIKTVSKTH